MGEPSMVAGVINHISSPDLMHHDHGSPTRLLDNSLLKLLGHKPTPSAPEPAAMGSNTSQASTTPAPAISSDSNDTGSALCSSGTAAYSHSSTAAAAAPPPPSPPPARASPAPAVRLARSGPPAHKSSSSSTHQYTLTSSELAQAEDIFGYAAEPELMGLDQKYKVSHYIRSCDGRAAVGTWKRLLQRSLLPEFEDAAPATTSTAAAVAAASAAQYVMRIGGVTLVSSLSSPFHFRPS